MTNRLATLILVAAMALLLAACGSDSEDVPTLIEDAPAEEPTAAAAGTVRDAEAAMMAFTECLREHGIEVYDPVVDAEGNVDKPEFVEGVDPKGEDMKAAWEACAEHLEGVTFGKKRIDVDDQVDTLDQYLALATCMRDKGYDMDEPTAETLNQWMGDFKDTINWDDPGAVADWEECSGGAGAGGSKK
jgi:hypothetical protein